MTIHTPPIPTTGAPPARHARTLQAVAWLGAAWNGFGLVRFVQSVGATPDALMAQGLDAAQAAVYLALPTWVTAAFGLGVCAGLIGSLALATGRRLAVGALALSLAAYVVLFAGDAAHGLFDAMPRQLGVLVVVEGIAVLLLALAVIAQRRGLLR